MKHIRKWLTRIGIVLLAFAIIMASAGTWLVVRPWPQMSGTIQAPGLQAQVDVFRDKWGVPNIYAQNEHDLFFAQGYVQAQDRLWQMEMIRRLTSGTLSEVLGEVTLDTDRYMRIIGLRRTAEQNWAKLDETSRSTLEIYAQGVNAYITTHRDRLPIEYTILGISPEPWTPVNSLEVGNLLALNMGLNQWREIGRAELAAKVGETITEELYQTDKNLPSIIPEGGNSFNWSQTSTDQLAIAQKLLGSSLASWGSNNWVVSGSRAASGKPLLANDTHVALQMPSIWYENGLHAGRFNSTGFTIPGVPLIILGHNQYIAWGVTNLDPDVQDLYIEKLDDRKNPGQYEFDGKWFDLETITETIPVKGNKPVDIKIFLTRHGPIINLTTEKEEPLAFRWTLYDEKPVFHAIIQLNLAQNWSEFHAALSDWDALSQNFVYADTNGNVGYQATGKIPIRTPHHSGKVPVPGQSGDYEWQGYIPYEKMPTLFNPPTGFIATANNKVAPDDYPYQLSCEITPGYRATRITNLLSSLSSEHRLTSIDMSTIQADTYSLGAETLRPYILAAIKPEDDIQTKSLEKLKAWNLYIATDQVGASIYETWFQFMLHDTIVDEIGSAMGNSFHSSAFDQAYLLADWMTNPDNVWFDDVTTPQRETRDDIIRRSFTDTVKWLSEHYGTDPGQWMWGRLHTTTFINDPLGQSGIPFVDAIVNGGPVASPGGMSTVNQAIYSWQDPRFSVEVGASQRMIIDLSNWDLMLAINSTGQSGHIFHPNFKDQIPLWQNVEYRPVPFTRNAVEKSADVKLILMP